MVQVWTSNLNQKTIQLKHLIGTNIQDCKNIIKQHEII